MGERGLEPGLGDDRANEIARPFRVNPAGLPHPEDLRHLGRLYVLVRVLRVVRGEKPGEFVPHIVDELRERAQPCQDYEVSRIEPLTQLVRRDGRISKDRRHCWSLRSGN